MYFKDQHNDHSHSLNEDDNNAHCILCSFRDITIAVMTKLYMKSSSQIRKPIKEVKVLEEEKATIMSGNTHVGW